ncbi:hypothetical protein P6144_04255 [Sphingomonas sp. HITSZ_GF]|uniref:hypothetical protein n=1 Tax=Sphingomonas sp. HITSZ_GF TaxID=3037247 RepID=UPI00240D36C1|nr:hypothetical protein [Sphingomonas sp. HITSZ_GF]MDG2532847.1 hypothetical protein [Sphingomonas sp. HITSZ_GF]
MRSLFAALFLLSASVAPAVPALAQDNTTIVNEADTPALTPTPQPAATPQAQTGTIADDPAASQVIAESGKALIVLFVLAAILESALAWFFNLPVVAGLFNGRNFKPIISCGLALAVTYGFQSVLLIGLFANYGYDTAGADAQFLCRLIESLVLAGGSAGVNRLLRNLGIRPIDPIAESNPTPQPLDAWISVTHRRSGTKGPVDVEIGTTAADGTVVWAIAGQVRGGSPLSGFASWLLRDRSRFPGSGGYVVTPGVPIQVRLAWTKSDGTVLLSPAWGPYALADRAIVDIDLTL